MPPLLTQGGANLKIGGTELQPSLLVTLIAVSLYCMAFFPTSVLNPNTESKPPISQKQDNPNLENAVAELSKEIRQLRLEFLESQLDEQDDRIARLEQEVRQVQREQLTLRDQERAILSGLGVVGGEEESSPEEKGMMSRMLETTRAQLASFAQQEANLKARLSRAQQRYSEIENKIKEMKGKGSPAKSSSS